MELGTRELSLQDLKDELSRVIESKQITEEFVSNLNLLPQEKITELKNLRANLDLLKSFDKKESKDKYIVFLTEREINLKKAIEFMERSDEVIYDPKNIPF